MSYFDQHTYFLCPVGRSQGTHPFPQSLERQPGKTKTGGKVGVFNNRRKWCISWLNCAADFDFQPVFDSSFLLLSAKNWEAMCRRSCFHLFLKDMEKKGSMLQRYWWVYQSEIKALSNTRNYFILKHYHTLFRSNKLHKISWGRPSFICVRAFLYILVLCGVYNFAFHDQYCLCAAVA